MIRQQGNVLPLGLALMALGMLGALVVFNTGTMATDKMQLANAADAAAYSGSQWQARSLNFQAYTNRAMLANQVSMAQAVTLQSWVAYGAVASENVATVLKPIPILNVIAEGVETGLRVVDKVVSPVTQAMLTMTNTVNKALSLAQEAMFVSTFVATPDVIKQVVTTTDPRFTVNTLFSGLGLAQNLSAWQKFSTSYDSESKAAFDERLSLINQSRDAFTKERNWRFFKNFWFYSTPLLRHRIYREGTTQLVEVETAQGTQWEWKAKDTMSLHNRLWRGWRGTKRYELPIGWAESYANTLDQQTTIEPNACTSARDFARSSYCARMLGMNRRSEYLADIGARSPVKQQKTRHAKPGYDGIQVFRALSQATIKGNIPSIQLKIEVAVPLGDVISGDAVVGKGEFHQDHSAPGDRLTSISVAEVFYQSPKDHGLGTAGLEKANLYNPYWSARLRPIPEQDRLLAMAMRGDSSSTVTPSAFNQTESPLSQYLDDASNQTDTDPEPTTSNDRVGSTPTQVDMQTSQGSFSQVVASLGAYESSAMAHLGDQELASTLGDSTNELLENGENSSSSLHDQGFANEDLDTVTEGRVDGLLGPAAEEPFEASIREAERMAQELTEEFTRIRTQVADEFTLLFEEKESELAGVIADNQHRIEQLEQQLQHRAYNEEDAREVERQIRFYESEITDAREVFREDLTESLVRIVDEATDLYSMPYREARLTVDEWIRTEQPEVILPWMELDDDEV